MSITNVPDEAEPESSIEHDESGLVVSEPESGSEVPVEKRAEVSKTSRFIAWIMDEAVSIPGTNVKIGIDPLLGLLPAGGDLAASCAGVFAFIEAVKRGLPIQALWKIVGNIILNAGVGTIPIIGDIFSVMFRSNSRNRDIINDNLRQALAEGREPSWWRVIPAVAAILVFVGCAITLNLYLWYLVTNFVIERVPGLDVGS
tara:strand:+ start:11736 stop:12338 length:603 start_codon:yes stop_codon:yes gene_type:complete